MIFILQKKHRTIVWMNKEIQGVVYYGVFFKTRKYEGEVAGGRFSVFLRKKIYNLYALFLECVFRKIFRQDFTGICF